MKHFLKNVSLFLLLSFCLFALSFVLLNQANNWQLTKFKLDDTVESVTIGDSHVELAIDDQRLPSTVNLSQRGDPFNYSLLKIKMVLNRKPSIKKIYLGVSYHNLSSYYNDYLFGKQAAGIDAKYLFILPIAEKLAIVKENMLNITVLLRLAFINGISSLHADQRKFSFLGRYDNVYKNTEATTKEIDRRIKEQFYEFGKIRDFSKMNTYYLNEIINLCKKNEVELIFLNTPLHPYYKSKIPVKFIDRFNTLARQHHLRVVDFCGLSLTDSCFTPDGDHVSQKGALLTTSSFLTTESLTKSNFVRR